MISDVVTNAGFEYDIQNVRMTQTAAEQFCVARAGHLTSISSDEENEFLTYFAGNEYNCGGRSETRNSAA